MPLPTPDTSHAATPATGPSPLRPPVALPAAVIAIAALYTHFLIFGEFAFLEVARPAVPANAFPHILGTLGLGGIGGSLLCAAVFRSRYGHWLASIGYAGCAAAAYAAFELRSYGTALFAAGLSGLSLGITTVSLALCLRPTVHLRRLGLACGLGTGLAYAVCNLPPVFNATPRIQILVAMGACMVGFAASLLLRSQPHHHSDAADYQPRAVGLWIVVFALLVGLDSAAFYVIQHTQGLKVSTWEGSLVLVGNGFVHLLAAVLAGIAIDRQRFTPTAVAASVCLITACLIIAGSQRHAAFARVLYMAAVSFYSTALVYYPARSGRRWIAGGLFALSGWIGSALGILVATGLQHVPAWLVGLAAVVLTAAFALRRWARGPEGTGLLFSVAVLGLIAAPDASARTAPTAGPEIALGRQVYVDEGCMYCHSQYVRPGTADVTTWGPAEPLALRLREQPPLFGNRRQGPDLSEVGTRRSPDWNRLHLQRPREVSPGSRMPSYAYLFRSGDPRGPALVAYLASLGQADWPGRIAIEQAWTPAPRALVAPAGEQARLFGALCAQCHGRDGRGDGPVAGQLGERPADLHAPWRRADPAHPDISLARIVKFGVPGTDMAGHETLSDAEVVSLVAYLETLQGR